MSGDDLIVAAELRRLESSTSSPMSCRRRSRPTHKLELGLMVGKPVLLKLRPKSLDHCPPRSLAMSISSRIGGGGKGGGASSLALGIGIEAGVLETGMEALKEDRVERRGLS